VGIILMRVFIRTSRRVALAPSGFIIGFVEALVGPELLVTIVLPTRAELHVTTKLQYKCDSYVKTFSFSLNVSPCSW